MSTKHKSSRLLMGNWKMNGSLASNQVLLDGLLQGLQQQPTEHQVVVCAPFVYLAQVQSLLAGTPFAWGAQDVSAHDCGSYFGVGSAGLLQELGYRVVVGGHFEWLLS